MCVRARLACLPVSCFYVRVRLRSCVSVCVCGCVWVRVLVMCVCVFGLLYGRLYGFVRCVGWLVVRDGVCVLL